MLACCCAASRGEVEDRYGLESAPQQRYPTTGANYPSTAATPDYPQAQSLPAQEAPSFGAAVRGAPTGDYPSTGATGAMYPQTNVATAPRPQRPPQPQQNIQAIEGGRILARVGKEVVLAGELLPLANDVLLKYGRQIPPEEAEQAKQMLMRQHLPKLIETKLIYAEARRLIPPENYPNVEQQLGDHFESAQVPNLIKSLGVGSRQELDAKLRTIGSSIAQQRQSFIEKSLASQWLRQQVDMDPQISYEQMLDYYNRHAEEYDVEARAKWQQLTANFARSGGRTEAYRKIAEMGNMVMQEVPFEKVAKEHSHGITAGEGGKHDWTTLGSLKSEKLDNAIFTLPVGRLSTIIEDAQGCHIIRVTEREEAGRTPFADVQNEVQEKVRREIVKQRVEDYLSRIRRDTLVWTVFDDEAPQIGSRGTTQNR